MRTKGNDTKGNGILIPKFKDFTKGIFLENSSFIKRLIAKGYDYNPQTFKCYNSCLEYQLLPKLADKRLNEITPLMIDDLLISMNYSNAYKNKTLIALKHIFKEAKKFQYITVNPMDTINFFKVSSNDRGILTDEEINKLFPKNKEELIKIWGNLKWALYFLIMLETGMRPNEVSGLKKYNYYIKEKGLYVDSSYRDGEIRKGIKTSSKGAKYKIGILSPFTAELMEEHLQKYSNDDCPLFWTDKGKLISSQLSLYRFKKAMSNVGLVVGNRSQYSLRHTFNTMQYYNLPTDIRYEFMGHKKERSEYDHRTAERRLQEVSKYRDVMFCHM